MEGENSNKSGESNVAGEDVQQLKSQLESLSKELESVKAAKSEIEKKQDSVDQELLSPEYLEFLESKRGKQNVASSAEDILKDDMSPTQIVKYLEGKSKGELEKISKGLTERLDSIEDSMSKTVAQIDLALTGLKHREFGEAFNAPPKDRTPEQKQLIDNVYRVANENPTWSAEKCYRQAKIEIRANLEELQEKERIKAEQERKALSEKGGVSASSMQGKNLPKDQAAELAWKSAFGNKQTLE